MTNEEAKRHLVSSLWIAIEALDKQIPKAPTYGAYTYGPGNEVRCCNCNTLLCYGRRLKPKSLNISFCWACGQAIDWEEEEQYVLSF